ncbi:low temperature requirement protein A [Cellulomonas alba]|uniref:Low temperature requirement protein A n=1 Tax=Cellulomonas alba TaxID=3053467 RepID=A0ABT7SK41_9CELL|nr:low temperature requirement protein A [Cellulomonas alba]MDM7856553.1 low temperature requirement protein A [Cellulomonas alba]
MSPAARPHGLRRMVGRDPAETGRTATPLELLFDLTFVAAFAVTGDEAAHLVAEGQAGRAAVAFLFVAFAVCWAWVSFSWFASAFDTDDWSFRVATLVQMVGVLVVALGAPAVFDSIGHGERLDNGIVVAGYVVMRVAMLAQWARVAREDAIWRRTAVTMAASIGVAQVGWVLVAVTRPPSGVLLPALVVLYALELGGPVAAQRVGGLPPWNAHHIAERYGLFALITLGEVVLGTITAVSAVVGRAGWSVEAVLVVVAGTGLAFGMWWSFFVVPAGAILQRHRGRAWAWGYGGIVLFSAIAAMGAGLHVAAYVVEGDAAIGVPGAVLTVAVPVLVATVAYFVLYAALVRSLDPFHLVLLAGTTAVLALALGLAFAGASLGWCLVVTALAPAVVVVGYETVGYRHMDVAVEAALR